MDHGELFNCEDDGDVVLLGGDFMDGKSSVVHLWILINIIKYFYR